MRPAGRIALYGGGRGSAAVRALEADGVVLLPSRRLGQRRQEAALSRLANGDVALVLIWLRAVGHTGCTMARQACEEAGIPYRLVRGGTSSVWREVRRWRRTHERPER